MSLPDGKRYFLMDEATVKKLDNLDALINQIYSTQPRGIALSCCLSEFRAIMTAYDNGVQLFPLFIQGQSKSINPYETILTAPAVVEINDTTSPTYDEIQTNPALQSRCILFSVKAVAEIEETLDSKNVSSAAEYIERSIAMVSHLVALSRRGSPDYQTYSLLFSDGKKEQYHPLFATDGGDIIKSMDIATRNIHPDAGNRLLAKLTKKRPPDETNG